MANTYVWDVSSVDVNNSVVNGHNDVIEVVHWTYTGTSDSEQDADNNYITASSSGSTHITAPSVGDTSVVAFDSVTKDDCKGWVLTALGITEAELQSEVDASIAEIVSPRLRSDTPSGW